jgi:cytochrome c peroxidase
VKGDKMKWITALFFSVTFSLNAVEPILPIPSHVPYNAQKAALGKKLFFDPILSKDYSVSCASCHDFSKGGADARNVSTGIHHQKGGMNAPTVLNSVFNFTQFWNGRAKNLTEQALGPIHNPVEMGLSPKEAAQRIQSHPVYSNLFLKITGRKNVNMDDIAMMIAEYEKTLITPNSKFDLYLLGKGKLSPKELEGYALFKTLGCVSCHNGVNVGGNSFQKMGAINPLDRKPNVDDRYAITHRESDKNVFKVPTLRNISLTAPYFHDGSAATLRDAITKMSYHNLGIKLTQKEIELLVTFLDTLTGELPLKTKQL